MFTNFSKILGTFSKSLNLVNQIIPIYKDTKPMIENARNAFSKLKDLTNKTSDTIINNTRKNTKEIKEIINNKKGPTFFM